MPAAPIEAPAPPATMPPAQTATQGPLVTTSGGSIAPSPSSAPASAPDSPLTLAAQDSALASSRSHSDAAVREPGRDSSDDFLAWVAAAFAALALGGVAYRGLTVSTGSPRGRHVAP